MLLYPWRFKFILSLFILALFGLIWRMIDLTVIDRSFLVSQGNMRTLRTLEMPAYRGMIMDRNGEPLAISTPVESVWVNPQDFNFKNTHNKKLAQLLKMNYWTLIAKIKKNKKIKKRTFVYLKRGVNPLVAEHIKALNVSGINFQREFKRFYPEGDVTAHLLGFTNVDDRGQEGLELAYDSWLAGQPGKKKVIKDRLGHIVEDLATLREPRPGHNLVLSIDRRIQYLAFKALSDQVQQSNASSGSIVVLNAKTGEILAIANLPTFNPNRRPSRHDGRYRNRAITDVFEPGSVIKAFSVASALQSGKFTPNSMIDTRPSVIHIGKHKVSDDRDNGIISLTQVLQRSSNVGVTKVTLALPPQHLFNVLHEVGFGQRTDIGFPGESSGVLINHRIWRPFVLATLAFGYGLSVTPLQLAHGYSIFANHGRLLPLTLLRTHKTPSGQQVLSSNVSDQMLAMLHAVVEQGGTGTKARIKGYTVAGKTGTARMLGAKGYLKNHHIATFVGIAPASAPQLVIAVVVTDPKTGHYYGGQIAAPVFAKVMAGTLRILNVLPDNLSEAKA